MARHTLDVSRRETASFPPDSCTGVRTALVELTALVDKDMRLGVNRRLLLNRADDLANSVSALWRNVQEGRVKVESVAVLRAVRDVSCRDLCCELNEPSLQHDRILRDLRLLTNMVDYVIVPEQEHVRSPCTCR
jgi:hypothetical protein